MVPVRLSEPVKVINMSKTAVQAPAITKLAEAPIWDSELNSPCRLPGALHAAQFLTTQDEDWARR